MGSSFILLLREGLEAALVLGIILGYLNKLTRKEGNVYVYGGALAGIAASILTALIFDKIIGGFEGYAEEVFEGLIMLLAVVVLTMMIFWMKEQSKDIGDKIKKKVDTALNNNQLYGLSLLSFFAVYREGVEVVLFFSASVKSAGNTGAIFGGIAGLMGAVLIAYLIFNTSRNINLKVFFQVTGGILLLISAGLLAHGIHELQEAGIVPVLIEHVYNLNGILNEKGLAGSFLKSMFGYNGNPSLLEIILYWGYLLTVGRGFIFNRLTEKKTV